MFTAQNRNLSYLLKKLLVENNFPAVKTGKLDILNQLIKTYFFHTLVVLLDVILLLVPTS